MASKGLIYEPAGRAREYAPLALNLYRGCGHGCTYCYAPAATQRPRADFHQAVPRTDIMAKLGKEAPLWRGETRPVLMSFTCDPYQPLDVELRLTRQAIQLLHANGLAVNILTKGGHRARRDFDLLTPADGFGVTLTGLDEALWRQWEPGAAAPQERVDTLREAHALGIPTWASLEPVIDAAETLAVIDATHEFVDLFKVGKMNYVSLPVDWRAFALAALERLNRYGSDYYLKADLRRYLEPGDEHGSSAGGRGGGSRRQQAAPGLLQEDPVPQGALI